MEASKQKQKPTPAVEDQFWFDMSSEIISESISNIDKGLAKLDTYITALWVIYTAASIFSVKYIKFTEDDFYWLIFGPHVLLLLGRCLIVLSQMPVRVDLVVNSPDLIKKAYARVFSRKRLSLLLGSIMSLLATISVIVTLTYSFLKNNELKNLEYEKANKIKPNLIVKYLQDKELLLFTAEISPNTISEITTIVISVNKDTIYNNKINRISTNNGIINGEFVVPKEKYGRIQTEIKWIDISEKNIGKSLFQSLVNVKLQ